MDAVRNGFRESISKKRFRFGAIPKTPLSLVPTKFITPTRCVGTPRGFSTITSLTPFFTALMILFFLSACAPSQFTAWQVEQFNQTPITSSATKVISLRNESATEEQHILGVGFDGSGDGHQHFRLESVSVGTRIVGTKNIIIPPGSAVNLKVVYEPRNLETTKADFGGWVTGEEKSFEPYKPGEAPKEQSNEAIHRVVLLAVYDFPKGGITQVELVGQAVVGPNGEISLPEIGVGDCQAEEGIACFAGSFSLDVEKLLTQGPVEGTLVGPIRFSIMGGKASLRMEDIPPIIIVLKGNGPGEPLEGQPVSSLSIVIRGSRGVTSEGSFDGSRLELDGLSFKIQVVVGEISVEDVASLSPIVDFDLEDLKLTTEEPLTDGHMTLKIDTTLPLRPSGNPIFDEFLGGARIVLRLHGDLTL